MSFKEVHRWPDVTAPISKQAKNENCLQKSEGAESSFQPLKKYFIDFLLWPVRKMMIFYNSGTSDEEIFPQGPAHYVLRTTTASYPKLRKPQLRAFWGFSF